MRQEMTLHKDPTWVINPNSWLHEWCLDCDNCDNHTHIPPTKSDPRMDERCNGWKLDIDGQDYCPECVNSYKSLNEMAKEDFI